MYLGMTDNKCEIPICTTRVGQNEGASLQCKPINIGSYTNHIT